VAFDLATLLEEELPETNRLAVIECGDGHERSLLRYTDAGGDLQFYFLDAHDRTVVRLERLVSPRGAQITLMRELRQGSALPGSRKLWPTRLIAKHETLPHGRIECDLRLLDQAEHERIADLFHSWVPTD